MIGCSAPAAKSSSVNECIAYALELEATSSDAAHTSPWRCLYCTTNVIHGPRTTLKTPYGTTSKTLSQRARTTPKTLYRGPVRFQRRCTHLSFSSHTPHSSAVANEPACTHHVVHWLWNPEQPPKDEWNSCRICGSSSTLAGPASGKQAENLYTLASNIGLAKLPRHFKSHMHKDAVSLGTQC
jgi:hypothetical protein